MVLDEKYLLLLGKTTMTNDEDTAATTRISSSSNNKAVSLTLSDFATLKNVHEATALSHWLASFWIPSQQRKHPDATLRFLLMTAQQQQPKPQLQIIHKNNNDNSNDDVTYYWEKQLTTAVKKIVVEDLGAMDAAALWETIPDTDSQGRGRQDLAAMQKELQVHVEFCASNKHVYLVGPKVKLTKKCITLRNVLSHYHWRLSGQGG